MGSTEQVPWQTDCQARSTNHLLALSKVVQGEHSLVRWLWLVSSRPSKGSTSAHLSGIWPRAAEASRSVSSTILVNGCLTLYISTLVVMIAIASHMLSFISKA